MDLRTTTDEELERIFAADEHNEYEDDEDPDYVTWVHAYWDCAACDAESELNRRRALRKAELPGNCPSRIRSHRSIEASGLKVGMVARYLSRPGVSDYPYEYAEALTVAIEDEVVVTWRRTNDAAAPVFTVTYGLAESLSIGEAV